nr:UTP--glucose-1-phosphate uridylyltransferase GalU [uncultured Methanoregula sp.]
MKKPNARMHKKKNSIKKAVIPAAGLGTRFLPITRAQPKEMLPVVDKPVIQYVVEEAIASGIEDILIITGRGKRAIEDHFDFSYELEQKLKEKKDFAVLSREKELSNLVDIHYIRQKEAKGLGDAVLLAERHCGDDPFVVLLGDTITIPFEGYETCTSQMIETFNKYQRSVIAIESVPREKIMDYGIIDGTPLENNVYQIQNIIEKPHPDIAPSNLGAIGRYLLTPDIFSLLKETKPGFGGELQLTDALIHLDRPLGLVTNCKRYDIGDKLGWMKSSIELTLQRDEFSLEMKKFLLKLLED